MKIRFKDPGLKCPIYLYKKTEEGSITIDLLVNDKQISLYELSYHNMLNADLFLNFSLSEFEAFKIVMKSHKKLFKAIETFYHWKQAIDFNFTKKNIEEVCVSWHGNVGRPNITDVLNQFKLIPDLLTLEELENVNSFLFDYISANKEWQEKK